MNVFTALIGCVHAGHVLANALNMNEVVHAVAASKLSRIEHLIYFLANSGSIDSKQPRKPSQVGEGQSKSIGIFLYVGFGKGDTQFMRNLILVYYLVQGKYHRKSNLKLYSMDTVVGT